MKRLLTAGLFLARHLGAPKVRRGRQLGANVASLNMEGLSLEYRKVAVEALSGSHTAARHMQFLHQDAFDPQSIDIQQLHFV